MSTRWLAAYLEAGGDAPVITLPPRAENAKIAKTLSTERPVSRFGYSGNFGTIPKTKVAAWDATDWREHFNERAGVAEYTGGMVRDKAERMAYESCITRWLDTHPPAHTNDAICPHCHKPNGAPGNSCAPVLSGNGGHVWLHHDCIDPWRAQRRQEAIAALAGMALNLTRL